MTIPITDFSMFLCNHGENMALRGDISIFSVSAIGRMIHEEKKTGVLEVSSRDARISLYFRGGDILFVRGTASDDQVLGGLIRGERLAGDETIEALIQYPSHWGKRVGRILSGQEGAQRKKLGNILRNHFKELLVRALSWKNGAFVYDEGLGGDMADILPGIHTLRFMAEAQKWKAFRDLIPSDQVVFEMSRGGRGAGSALSDAVLRVMLLIDGQRDVSQLISQTGLPRKAVYRSLTELLSQGIIGRKSDFDPAGVSDALSEGKILNFYLRLIQDMTAGTKAALGEDAAVNLVETCLQVNPYHPHFLHAMDLKSDVMSNADRIQGAMRKNRAGVSAKDLVDGFNRLIASVLREQYRILGIKAAQQTVNLTQKAASVSLPRGLYAAETLNQLLDRCCREMGLACDAESSSAQTIKPPNGATGHPPPPLWAKGPPDLVVYLTAVEVLTAELKAEIGTRAAEIARGVADRLAPGEPFFSRFDSSGTAAENLRRFKGRTGAEIRQMDVVRVSRGLGQVLAALLKEARRLLGERAARGLVTKVEEGLADAVQDRFSGLRERLDRFLTSVCDEKSG